MGKSRKNCFIYNVKCFKTKLRTKTFSLFLDNSELDHFFHRLATRIQSMEGVIENIVCKIDTVLIKLQNMERSKTKRKANAGKILDVFTMDSPGGECHPREARLKNQWKGSEAKNPREARLKTQGKRG
jgi:hypothetical protein